MDYTKITLGELLSSVNETIKRNAVSILKQLQKMKKEATDQDLKEIEKIEEELEKEEEWRNQ